MSQSLPHQNHFYQNHHLDSTHWNNFIPRHDDIVISTSIKSGTTWMQSIVTHLVFLNQDVPLYNQVSFWIDFRIVPPQQRLAAFEAQKHRRIIKSHIPLDGIPFFTQLKYIVVARDSRDVFMSLWNHYKDYTPQLYQQLNTDQAGEPVPYCPEDIHDFWQNWITKGWFSWEKEGYPFWGNMHHTHSWWSYRNLANVLLIHYNDLLLDPEAEIMRIAEFLEIEVTDFSLASIVQKTSFDVMKKRLTDKADQNFRRLFRGGANTFFNKGKNKQWQSILTYDELDLYHQKKAEVLSTDCIEWLEHGRLGD